MFITTPLDNTASPFDRPGQGGIHPPGRLELSIGLLCILMGFYVAIHATHWLVYHGEHTKAFLKAFLIQQLVTIAVLLYPDSGVSSMHTTKCGVVLALASAGALVDLVFGWMGRRREARKGIFEVKRLGSGDFEMRV